MNKLAYILISIIVTTGVLLAEFDKVTIISISGQVKVRQGLDENWTPAGEGMQLKPVDTILSEEDAQAVIEIPGKGRFVLGENSMLDIGDLRDISEKEMFLFLMSQKVQKMSPHDGNKELKIGNVSVVHGEDRGKPGVTEGDRQDSRWEREKNGAEALLQHEYYTNAVVKLTNILLRYPGINDCGEVHYFLGKAFEALNKKGQAVDAYREVLNAKDCESASARKWHAEAQMAIEKLK
ncbi:hypothetical protein GF337_05155 [candidate division KSB1 bacterium]|nr:hypothetical protein [candidate division KSB1 bacterium]